MTSPETRTDAIAEIARLLPQRTGRLGRVLWRSAHGSLPRGMANTLAALERGPSTVGRLAELEGVAQPTMTRTVGRLAAKGLVRRERAEGDGRVVVVALTDVGAAELAAVRDRYVAVLRERLAGLPDDRLEALLRASEAIESLLEALSEHQ